MTGTGGQHLHGFHDVGFAQSVRPLQDVHSRLEIEHATLPGTVVVEREP